MKPRNLKNKWETADANSIETIKRGKLFKGGYFKGNTVGRTLME